MNGCTWPTPLIHEGSPKAAFDDFNVRSVETRRTGALGHDLPSGVPGNLPFERLHCFGNLRRSHAHKSAFVDIRVWVKDSISADREGHARIAGSADHLTRRI